MTDRFLLDTHLLLWTAGSSERLSPAARTLIADPANALLFSSASIWEVAIKAAARRSDFQVDAARLAAGLTSHGFVELPITSAHAARVALIPPLHHDPFDRVLIAQAQVEALTLLTSDRAVARYPGNIRLV